jgi:hypothetical protein
MKGIDLFGHSNNNSFYHNTIRENSYQVQMNTSTCFDNAFDDGIGVGNYWDDYFGLDDGSNGRTPLDGVGDTEIPHPNTDQGNGYFKLDNYPLMESVFNITPPRIQLNSPEIYSVITPYTTLDFDVYDKDLDYVTYEIDFKNEQNLMLPYDIPTEGWDDGNHSVYIRATDIYDNTAAEIYYFTIDNTKPQIYLDSHEENAIISPGTYLYFSIIDRNLVEANYSLDGGEEISFSPEYNISSEGWSDGLHTIQVNAIDAVGHTNSSYFHIRVDAIPPAVVHTNPENNSLNVDPRTTFVITFSESMVQTNLWDYLEISPFRSFGFHWDFEGINLFLNFSNSHLLPNTVYTITISSQISDVHGNSMESDYILVFTTTPLDTDSDGIFDHEDPDDDNDGFSDEDDAFPLDDSEWLDTDLDNIGDNADQDDDNDGVPDHRDDYPKDPTRWQKEESHDFLRFIFVIVYIIVIVSLVVVLLFLRQKKRKSGLAGDDSFKDEKETPRDMETEEPPSPPGGKPLPPPPPPRTH